MTLRSRNTYSCATYGSGTLALGANTSLRDVLYSTENRYSLNNFRINQIFICCNQWTVFQDRCGDNQPVLLFFLLFTCAQRYIN